MERTYRLRPRRIVLLYISFATLWIVGSDYLADLLFTGTVVHSFKGEAFVLATGGLLYAILRRAEASMRAFQDSLLASREAFERMVENAPEAILIQAGGTVRYSNPAGLRLLGALDAGQVRGRPFLDFVAPDWHEAVQTRIRMLNEERKPAPPMEMRYRRLDGTLVEVEASAAPFEDAGEKCAVVFIRDLSEHKRAERQKEHLEEEVRQAQKMESIGLLAGGVAHDFNNLLTVINGYAEMILQDLPQGDPKVEGIQEIRDAGARAESLTRQLLAFSRKEIAEWEVLDLNAVIREMERMLGRLVGEHIGIRTGLDGSIGRVLADRSWIHQVLVNLVVNARDAMPSGGEITIRTAAAEVDQDFCRTESEAAPGRYVRLTVADSGVGMAPEVQVRAFEPFFTTKPRGQGTGLGLSTVYGIVRQSGGWITADSRLGEGTTMTIWLPVHDGAPGPSPPPAGDQALRGHETILLVEDDPGVLQAAATMLRQYGYSVAPAGSPAEAIELAGRNAGRIDLLLSDVMMPGMTGPQLAERLRAGMPGLKTLLMSGYRADLPAPESPFISKPFTAAGLVRRVRAVLDGR